MAKPVTHLSRIRTIGDRTITGTICNRMANTGPGGDLNVTTDAAEVTCKFCLKTLSADRRGKALAKFEAA